jgi:hypothetical protein
MNDPPHRTPDLRISEAECERVVARSCSTRGHGGDAAPGR